jgi:hypothetical protein
MLLLIQLRWIAVAGQIATIVFVERVLGISLPLVPMTIVVVALVASISEASAGCETGERSATPDCSSPFCSTSPP